MTEYIHQKSKYNGPATLLNSNTCRNFTTRCRVPGAETPATPKTDFFVILVDDWRPQTNKTTKIFTLNVVMVLVTSL